MFEKFNENQLGKTWGPSRQNHVATAANLHGASDRVAFYCCLCAMRKEYVLFRSSLLRACRSGSINWIYPSKLSWCRDDKTKRKSQFSLSCKVKLSNLWIQMIFENRPKPSTIATGVTQQPLEYNSSIWWGWRWWDWNPLRLATSRYPGTDLAAACQRACDGE